MPTPEQERAAAAIRIRRRRAAQTQEAEGPKLGLKNMLPWNVAKGFSEMGLNAITGSIASPIAEGAATIRAALSEDTPENRQKVEETAAAAEKFTYQPQSDEGKMLQNALAQGVQAIGLDRLMEWVANPTSDDNAVTGEHLVKTVMGVAPFLGQVRKVSAVTRAGRTTPAAVRNAGIDVDQPGQDITRQLTDIAEKERIETRGSSTPAIREGLRAAAETHRTRTRALYAAADDMGGNLDAPSQSLHRGTEAVTDNYNVYDSTGAIVPGMHAVDKRLADFRATFVPDKKLRLSEIESYRQRLLRDARRSSNDVEKEALQYMRRQLDTWEMNEFKDVVMGRSKETFDAYLRARESSLSYVKKFVEEPALAKLIADTDITTTEMRNLIFGAQSNGIAHAGIIVRRLNNIFGADSRQMRALRQDFLYDVTRPLIENPGSRAGVDGFVRNYERLIAKNPDLVQELAPFSKTSMEQVYHTAKSLLDEGLTESQLMARLDPVKTLVRLTGLNPLAKGTAQLGLFESAVRVILNTAKPNRRRLYENLFGYDPDQPIRKMNVGARAGIVGAELSNVTPEDETEQ